MAEHYHEYRSCDIPFSWYGMSRSRAGETLRNRDATGLPPDALRSGGKGLVSGHINGPETPPFPGNRFGRLKKLCRPIENLRASHGNRRSFADLAYRHVLCQDTCPNSGLA